MGHINIARVIAGGLLAGLVINVSEAVLNLFVIGTAMNDALASLNRPPVGGGQIGVFIFLCFVLGIATVWLYAAIRPRYGPGVQAAATAGLFVWFFAYIFPNAGMIAMQLFPAGAMLTATAWGLFEIVAAAILGAWVYRE